jgi:hypothetical protein
MLIDAASAVLRCGMWRRRGGVYASFALAKGIAFFLWGDRLFLNGLLKQIRSIRRAAP